ncbi:hypothetical protein [Oscillatoria sp. FACHB-1406]|uniref:hypothetical protein n=1 Tax=Oscillatoria sp. FACHB-1406 TaxID=2692846 RepID=UPI0016879049|nr:hypothetical protein [Oscillatoria sp. FACHB-1406]MBD2578937.1 hypothetical protein [Oscillatoria sp. FACHB-1406]
MKDWSSLKKRYLRDNLSIRLGNLASNLSRIRSRCQKDNNSDVVKDLFRESQWFIEWTAAEAEIDVAAELVELQVQLACWQYSWDKIWGDEEKRRNVADRAKNWSDKVLARSGLLSEN